MNRVLSFFFVLCLMLGFGIASAQTTYTKVTSADQLVIGGKYIIVGEDATNGAFAMGGQKNNNRAANSITISGSTVSVTEATQNSTDNVPNQAVALVLGAATGNAEYYTFYDAINNGYLYAASSSSNQMKTQATNNENGEWNITFNGNVCSIVASASSNRNVMQFNYNSGTPLFSCYASANQTAVSLYVDATSLSDDPAMTVTAPANGALIFSSSTPVSLTIRNFELGTDGKVKYTLDNEEAQYSTYATFVILGMEDGDHNLALELVDMDGESLETPVTANVTFTTDGDLSTLLTIPEIQGTEDENAYNGQIVATQGVVTAKTQYGFYIQSSTDAYSGLYIYAPDYVDPVNGVNIGTNYIVRGTMTEYNGLTEMNALTHVVPYGGNTFEPVELSLDEISEQYESMFVKVTGTFNGTTLGGAWQIANGENTLYVGNDCYTYSPIENMEYEIMGTLSYSNKESYNVGWVILPRRATDITENVDGIALRVFSPTEGSIIMDDNVTVEFRVYNFDLGTDGKMKYALNNGEAQYITSEAPFIVNNLANGSNTLAFDLVTMENASLETPVTATVTFEARTNGQLAIRDIQYTTAEDGASPLAGQTVTVSGTVTALNSDKFYIQDAEAAWSGLYIYNTNSDRTPARNDNVTVTGTITEYNGLTEMNPTAVVNNGAATPINGVALANISEISEAYESVLVTVTGTCTNIGGAKKWTISDGTSIVVFGLTYTPTVGTSYTVTGIVDWFGQDGIWELKPRDEADIVVGGSVPTISITNPANGSTIYSAAVNVTVEVFNFTVGIDGNISFSIDDGETVSGTGTSHAFTGLTNGEHTIHANLVANDQSVVASAASTFTVNLAGPTFTAIRDIQYTNEESGDSPLNNQTVWVKGVVTSNFLNTPYSPVKGYSIQDANDAWSGVWVFDSINNPNIGDSVKLQALVTEYYGLTELKNVANYEVFDIGVATPINVTVNEAKSEAYEGCYVRVECVRSTGHTMPYGNWTCVNAAGDTVTFSHNFANDAYTIQDDKYYSVAGVVEYSYGKYYVNYPTVNDIIADCDASVDEMLANAIEVYPNPTNGQINIANAEGQNIVVINTLGQVVASIDNATENQTIDMSGLCEGTYFVKVGTSVVKINVIR
ncbi:MAG: T9SS type A sorting domain-containing protein [Bacteroidales bacterium]|nr:T9SS type A sorting domain-containing protein [Bacteroidales bacterium]